MNLNVEKELAALRRMSVGQLRQRYAEVFGEPTRSRHKQWLIKRILWRMQALAEGDLSRRAGAGPRSWPTTPTCGSGRRGRLPRRIGIASGGSDESLRCSKALLGKEMRS